jgi:hypothetical protein
VLFDTSSSDAFVQARATAIGSEVPGAILRSATQQLNGPQATFDDPEGFLNIANHVYVRGSINSCLQPALISTQQTQHLAFSGKSVYFVADNQALPAQMTSLVPKLLVQ